MVPWFFYDCVPKKSVFRLRTSKCVQSEVEKKETSFILSGIVADLGVYNKEAKLSYKLVDFTGSF